MVDCLYWNVKRIVAKNTGTFLIRCKYLENMKSQNAINKTFDDLLSLLQHGMNSANM